MVARAGHRLAVEGRILFDPEARTFLDATAYVQLEEVTVADARAPIVAEQVLRHVKGPQSEGIPFRLLVGEIDQKGDYSVRVHIDVDGDSRISKGDFISTQSYPVLTFGRPVSVSVRVREV